MPAGSGETPKVAPPTPPDKPGAEGGKPSSDAPSPAAPVSDKPKAGAPEKYEAFKTADGQDYDAAVNTEFSAIAKELGLPQDVAQSTLNRWSKFTAERQQKQAEQTRETWVNAAKADKELSANGAFDANVKLAQRTFQVFGDPELARLLAPVSEGGGGLGDHPALVRWAYRVATKALSEDKVLHSAPTGNGAGGPRTFEEAASRLYPQQAKS